MVYYNQNKQKGNKYMTTNSKNSRMRYHGFNNNRMYQASLRIKRDNKKFERTLSKGLSCIGRTFGFLMPFFASPIKIVKLKLNNKLLKRKLSVKNNVFKNSPSIIKRKRKNRKKEMG